MQRYILHAKEYPTRKWVMDGALSFIQRLPDEKSWEITIKLYRKPRSKKQNAALWAVAYPSIMAAIGLQGAREMELLHWQLCGEFFGWVDKAVIGHVPKRTTTHDEMGQPDTIDTGVAAEFYKFIQRLGAENGIDVPDPDPLYFERGD